MRRSLFSFLIFLILLLSSWNNSFSQSENENNRNLTAFRADLIRQYISGFPEHTKLSFAFIENGIVNYAGVDWAGNKMINEENRDSVFEIGSITKLFTSTLLSGLAEEHVLKLDDPIEDILPYRLNKNEKGRGFITLKTLANHTSGLPRMPDNYVAGYDTALLRNYLQEQLNLNSVPGEKYQYSNLGVGLLGYLLEIKTGRSYEELLQERIFRKYGMVHTTSAISKVSSLVVAGRDSTGRIIPNWHADILRAAGGILSDVRDLSQYVLSNFSDDPVLTFQRKVTYTGEGMDLALGWHILKFGGNTCRWYFHNGGMDGYRSCLFMDPDTKSAVVILSNLSAHYPGNENIDQLCRDLFRIYSSGRQGMTPLLLQHPSLSWL
jgi:CubicO group peptidase (beta-lactamase class C family)